MRDSNIVASTIGKLCATVSNRHACDRNCGSHDDFLARSNFNTSCNNG